MEPDDRTFTGSVEVTLSCDTDGATIYYTTDGAPPTTGSTKYESAFTLDETATIKAFAVKGGLTDSAVIEATYTKNAELPEPPEPPEQPDEPIEKPDNPTWVPPGDDNDDDDSDYDPTPIVRPLAPAEKWMTAANWRSPSRESLKFGVRVSAWNALIGRYYHDNVRGSTVEARTYFDDPSLFTADSYVSGWLTDAEVDRVRATFEKWFTNKVRVIHFDRVGLWEHPVRVAARVDLTGWDTRSLVIYAYDPKTNFYRKLAAPTYWIDANGYLRFATEYAGEIIISEEALNKR